MPYVTTYDDLYRICEELQQLVGAPLQSVHGQSAVRFVLGFRLPGESRDLILDLTPSQPFIVSTSSTKLKGLKSLTPVLNFLKAHYVGKHVEKIEIAQKPNRTLKIVFRGGESLFEMIFKCFPHGQHLILLADKKFVNMPLRPKPSNAEEEEVTFIEAERHEGWEFNDFLARKWGLVTPEDSMPEIGGEVAHGYSPYKLKLIKKLEKSIRTLDEGVQKSKLKTKLKSRSFKKRRWNFKRRTVVGHGSRRFLPKLKNLNGRPF